MTIRTGLLVAVVLHLILFAILVTVILPSYDPQMQAAEQTGTPLSALEEKGRDIYIREGCWGCHSQQVRSIEHNRGMVHRPGDIGPASVAEDLALQRPALLSTQRRGPDLSNVGDRLPSEAWHIQHHKDPRAFAPSSWMPPYDYLTEDEMQALAAYMVALRHDRDLKTDLDKGPQDPDTDEPRN